VASSAIRENPSIGERFLDSSGRPQFSHEFLRRVMMRPLAANVRELRQLTLLSLTKSKGTTLDWVEPQSSDGPEPSAPDDESALIQRTLDENNGSIEKTWRALGLGSRFALMRRLKKHKLVVRKKAE
jgi:DNA-binding NtrC family response regulator